jgi:hypothetical protein
VGALLLITGAVGGVIVSWWPGPLTPAHLVFAPGVTPPWPVTLLALALGAGAALGAPKPLRKVIKRYSVAPSHGTPALLLTFAAVLLVIAWAQAPLRHALTTDARWRQATAVLAIVALPLGLFVAVLGPGRPRPAKT